MATDIDKIIQILRETTQKWREPIVTEMTRQTHDPFKVLVSTIISLRTKDEVTREASHRLYILAETPETMLVLPTDTIEKAIYPAGFYRNKARTIIAVCRTIMTKYGGKVPDDLDELLKIKGIGRKTANLVLTKGFGKPGICVDTHVHRISNRLGYVVTKNPVETEFELRKILPEQYWIEYNDLLVTFGQNMCKPVSPHCSECPIHNFCNRTGVKQHR
ncbi:endonuclease III [bacterium]|nr:endonuclease III [bacterium]